MRKVTEKRLRSEYNRLRNDCISCGTIVPYDYLSAFTDYELFIFIAGSTLAYGRSFEMSIENAECHLEDRESRERAIKSFSGRLRLDYTPDWGL